MTLWRKGGVILRGAIPFAPNQHILRCPECPCEGVELPDLCCMSRYDAGNNCYRMPESISIVLDGIGGLVEGSHCSAEGGPFAAAFPYEIVMALQGAPPNICPDNYNPLLGRYSYFGSLGPHDCFPGGVTAELVIDIAKPPSLDAYDPPFCRIFLPVAYISNDGSGDATLALLVDLPGRELVGIHFDTMSSNVACLNCSNDLIANEAGECYVTPFSVESCDPVLIEYDMPIAMTDVNGEPTLCGYDPSECAPWDADCDDVFFTATIQELA